jgi:hypothetical protein
MKNQLIEDIKNFRVSIDGLMQLVKAEIKSAEMQVCYNKLKYAKAWSGIGLQQLGNPTPYQNDGNRKDVSDIEETADTDDYVLNTLKDSNEISEYSNKNNIEKIDWLREEIQRTLNKFGAIEVLHLKYVQEQKLQNFYDSQIKKIHFKTFHLIEQYLHESRFELGFELQRMKEVEDKNKATTEGSDKRSDEIQH